MLSKYLPLTAIFIVALMIVPQFASATTYSTNTTIVEMSSEHEDQYDALVNVANESSMTNVDTWDPAPQGIWIGGSTEESSLRLDPIFASTSMVALTWEFTLASSQIMTGVGNWVMRFPFATTDVDDYDFYIYAIPSHGCYSSVFNTTKAWVEFSSPVYQICYDFGGHDASYSDGDNYWELASRPYLEVNAPLLPGQMYLAVWYVTLIDDGRMSVFLSPNDVCTDEDLNSSIAWSVLLDPTTYQFENYSLEVDLGVSFDMRSGLGNGAAYAEEYVPAGHFLWFKVWGNFNNTNAYHVLNLPLYTDNGSSRWSLQCFDEDGNLLWSNSATTYYNGILECSATTVNLASNNTIKFIDVMLTSTWSQKVKIVLGDKENVNDNWGRPWNVEGNVTEYVLFGHTYYNLGPVVAYQLSTVGIATPNVNPAMPWPQLQAMEQSNDWDTLWIVLSGIVGLPVVLIQVVAGTELGRELWAVVNGIYNNIYGQISNAIDSIWNTLIAIGDFIWSVGEWIYDALVWLADAIMEYGSILLGLLIIAVALFIFFFFTNYLAQTLEAFLLMAQGKFSQGSAKGLAISTKMLKQVSSPTKKGYKFLKRRLK